MKRTSVVVVAAAVVALALTGCGNSEESSDANGLRKGTTSSAPAASSAQASATAPAAADDPAPVTESQASAGTTTVPHSTDPALTTCAEFRTLDAEGEKAVIASILEANPNSEFAGSPNVALSTAKLVCLASTNKERTVAAAAGIAVG